VCFRDHLARDVREAGDSWGIKKKKKTDNHNNKKTKNPTTKRGKKKTHKNQTQKKKKNHLIKGVQNWKNV